MKLTDSPLDSYNGCLLFGSRPTSSRAPFIPHENEARAVETEKGADCAKIKKVAEKPSKEEVVPISLSLEVFAPSYAADTKNTMSRLSISTEIEPAGEKLNQTISVEFGPAVENQKYYWKGFLLIPPEGMEKAYANYTASSGGIIIDDPKGMVFKAEIDVPKRPTLRTLRYEIRSADGEAVAAAGLPMWVEADD